jgi:UBX domain-containing protein 1
VGQKLSGGPSAPEAAPPPPAAAGPAAVSHTITFWHNGFTVDGGPLRKLDDPANAPFMNAIAQGLCPEELRPADPAVNLSVNLVRKESDWTAPPEPKYRAYDGTAHTLGGGGGSGAGGAAVASSWEVDEMQPVTSLQLRLGDGQRVLARFNTRHTLAHVRAFIEHLRPGTGGLGVLQAGMPPRTLADEGVSLQDAGLLNSVLMQKL